MKKGYILLIMIYFVWLFGCSNNNTITTVGDIFQNQKDIKAVYYNNEVLLNKSVEIQNFKELIEGIKVKEISHEEFREIFQSLGEFREKQESLALFLHHGENIREEPPSIIIEVTSDGTFTLNELDEEGKVITDYLITEKHTELFQEIKRFFPETEQEPLFP